MFPLKKLKYLKGSCIAIICIALKAIYGNAALDNLENNIWLKLDPAPSSRYIPRGIETVDTPETSSQPVGRAYSGSYYGGGKIFYYGGGHAAYVGNDVEVYDIENNVWTQSYNPEVCLTTECTDNATDCGCLYGGAGVRPLTPLGRPYTEHTYQQLSWDPVSQKLFALLNSGTWYFDPVTMAWDNVAGPHVPSNDFSPVSNTACMLLFHYDEDLGTHQALTTGAGNGLFTWQNGSWARTGNKPSGWPWTSVYSEYIPDQHCHVVYMNKESSWWKYSSANQTWTQWTGVPSIMHFAYDTQNKVLVGLNSSSVALWAHDFSTGQWTQLSPEGTKPASISFTVEEAGPLFHYDPVHNVFIYFRVGSLRAGQFVGGEPYNQEIWAFRYGSGSQVEQGAENLRSMVALRVFPNPFTKTARISIQISNGKLHYSKLGIYDIKGKLVMDFITNDFGNTAFNWKPDNLPCGIYVLKLKTGDKVLKKRLILLR
jgi:hypothetical protein